MRILIIDDNKELADTVASFFEIKKIQCKITTDCKEGLDCMVKEKFDFVLLDLNMPKFSGFNVYTHLKKTNMLRMNKIIIITAQRLFENDIREMMHSGIQRVMRKPFSLMELYAEITKLSGLPSRQTVHV